MASEFDGARTVAVDGTTLAYRERGHGEPVVFVHGALSDMRTWTPQVEEIGQRHRAIAYSCRYARPDGDVAGDDPSPLLTHADDLAALLASIDAAPAHLVGNSSGAFVSLITAIRHPHLVRTLVLQEPPVMTLFVSPQPRPGELLRVLMRRPRTAAAIVRMGAGFLAPAEKAFRRGDDEAGMLRFLRGVLGPRHFERLTDARRQQARENVSDLKRILTGGDMPKLSDDQVRGVSARTLLVTGEDSPSFGLRLTDRLQELLPQAGRTEIPGASHLAHEDNPPAMNAAILRFLSRRDE